jgi:hypothetical protein
LLEPFIIKTENRKRAERKEKDEQRRMKEDFHDKCTKTHEEKDRESSSAFFLL